MGLAAVSRLLADRDLWRIADRRRSRPTRCLATSGFSTCLLFTFATLYPEVEFRLFFIIPVKVKYLAMVAAAILVYSSLSFGIVGGLANIVGVSSGYLFFLAIRRLPSRRKICLRVQETSSRGGDPV